jgi:hypothetical protein
VQETGPDLGGTGELVTTATVFQSVLRRWYVTLLGLAATVLVVASMLTSKGVYWSQVNVVFLPPHDATEQTGLVSSSKSVIAMAGLVEREVNATRTMGASTSAQVQLTDTGVRHGSLVLLPNLGGQFDYNFAEPVLSVQAAGSTPAEVRRRRDAAVAEINGWLRRLQSRDGTVPSRMITTRLSPQAAPVLYNNGHPSRAAGVALFVGLGLTVTLSVALDRPLARLLGRFRLRLSVRRRSERATA